MANGVFTKADLAIAKIVATPTLLAWSQAYNAGNLFAIVLLTREASSVDEMASLSKQGKAVVDTLEQEYFTLEVKNLSTIQKAVEEAARKAPDEHVSLAVGAVVQKVLYVFVQGNVRVLLLRRDKLGTILSHTDMLESASGFVQNKDTIVFETGQFENLITDTTLTEALLFSVQEAAETLSPTIHGQEGGGEAALIVQYNEPIVEPFLQSAPTQEETDEEVFFETHVSKPNTLTPNAFLAGLTRFIAALLVNAKKFIVELNKRLMPRLQLDRRRKFFLVAAATLSVVLAVSIVSTISQQEARKQHQRFEDINSQAQQKVSEGEALLSLNKNLARDSLLSAKEIIEKNKDQFKPNTKERKDLDALLDRVNSAIASASNINAVKPTSVEAAKSPLLSYIKSQGFLRAAQVDTAFFGIDGNGVYKSSSVSQKGQKIITNNGDWENVGGFGVYLTNLYVLDTKKAQLFKFVPSGSDYTKTNYFQNAPADLKDGVSLAIDGNIWVLTKQEGIKKYLRGKEETFAISGLDTPLKNPTRLLTSSDTDKLYVLDNDNSRIVILSKNGSYLAQYNANVFKNTTDIDVSEKEKKLYILSEGKMWEVGIQ